MSYDIHIGKRREGSVVVTLYKDCPIDIPPYISIGVVNREKRYNDWLNAAVEDEHNDPVKAQRLRFLAFIHKVGRQEKAITLQSENRLEELQVKCVKRFLEEYRDFLDAVLPYLFADEVRLTERVPGIELTKEGV